MPITLIDILKPKNNQPFPMVEDIDLLGGFRVVPAEANRDAIGYKLKKHGMLVLVSNTKVIWSWNAPLSAWEVAIDLNTVGGTSSATQNGPIFVAECPSNAIKGDLVYTVPNWHQTVDFVDVHNVDKLPAIGTIIEKPDPITCKVQTSGIVTGVYSGLLPGKRYFTGTNYRPVSTAPTAPVNGALFHQPIGMALDPVTLILSPSVNLTRIRG